MGGWGSLCKVSSVGFCSVSFLLLFHHEREHEFVSVVAIDLLPLRKASPVVYWVKTSAVAHGGTWVSDRHECVAPWWCGLLRGGGKVESLSLQKKKKK